MEPTLTPNSPSSMFSAMDTAPVSPVSAPVSAPTPTVSAPVPVPERSRASEPAVTPKPGAPKPAPKTEPAAKPARAVSTKPKSTESKHVIREGSKFLGLKTTAKDDLDKMAARIRDSGKGNVVDLPVSKKDESKLVEVAKPEETAPEPTPEPVATSEPPKNDSSEKLAKELEELKAELRALKEPKEQPKPEASKTPEEIAAEREKTVAERKAADRAFVENQAKELNLSDLGLELDEDKLDTILAGGKNGLGLFMDTLGKVAAAADLRTRRWAEEQLNPVLEHLHTQMAPVLERNAEIAAYQRETKFFEANPDLRPVIDVVREQAQKIDKAYKFAKLAQEKGFATPEHENYVKTYESFSQEDYDKEVADQVRELQKKYGANLGQSSPSSNNPAAPAPVAAPPPARPKPPTAQLGGANAPTNGPKGNSMINTLRSFEHL